MSIMNVGKNNKFEDMVDNGVNSLAKFLAVSGFKTTRFVVCKSTKVTFSTIKGIVVETASIKRNWKSTMYRRVSLAATLTIGFIILYKTDLRYVPIAVPVYLAGRHWVKEIMLKLKYKKDIIALNKLNKKYRNLLEQFDGLKVVEVTDSELKLYNTGYISIRDLENKLYIFEAHFNRKITGVYRDNRDLRVYTMIFRNETKFNKYYRFDRYIDHADFNNMYLPLVIGVDQKGVIQVEDLSDKKHIFISGESGGGKSSMLNCIIQSLMVFSQNTIYIVVDLKGGAEMSEYLQFPHVIFLHKIDTLINMINVLHNVMEIRLNKILRTKKCKNARTYNNLHPKNKMSDIVLIIDEIASLRLAGLQKKSLDSLEHSLLEILQKGRVCNMYCIAATQKPSGEQISTDVRAGFLYNVSFRVNDKHTEQQTKVPGCKHLQIGEYKTTLDNTVRKGFLILEARDTVKGLPKCNEVFEHLEKIIVEGQRIITVEPKKVLPVSRSFLYILLTKINKCRDQEPGQTQDFKENVLAPSMALLDEVAGLRNEAEIPDFSPGKSRILQRGPEESHEEGMAEKALSYFRANLREYRRIPLTKDIENYLKISERKRKDLLKELKEKGLLELKGTQYYLKEEKTNV